MRTLRISAAAAGLVASVVVAPSGHSQSTTGRSNARTDSVRDTVDFGFLRRPLSKSSLTLSSGGTYNRVEGLPIHFGPVLKQTPGKNAFTLSALGILRSAHGFHWDERNVGHLTRA
jgi:hypothetical protein